MCRPTVCHANSANVIEGVTWGVGQYLETQDEKVACFLHKTDGIHYDTAGRAINLHETFPRKILTSFFLDT
jgi:hypothetical protein